MVAMFSRSAYSALSGKESTDSNAPLLYDHENAGGSNKKTRLSRCLHWVFHGISLLAIVGLVFGLNSASESTQRKCWSMFNYYSPVDDAVAPHPYVPRVFNGSLWYQSPWKGPPTEKVEEAWYDIMRYGMISVSKEDIEKVQHPDWSAQFPPEAGGGYIAATIGTHQLHCLHYIWQDHYMEYFPKTQDKKQRVPELYERHYEHCVEIGSWTIRIQRQTPIPITSVSIGGHCNSGWRNVE